MNDDFDDDRLPVRSTDPETSYAAALKASFGASRVRPVALKLITEHGPVTHDELIRAYQNLIVIDRDTPYTSPSGLRTRVRELVEAGLVTRDLEKGRSEYGNAAIRWIATSIVQAEADDPANSAAFSAYLSDPDSPIRFNDTPDDEDQE